MARGRQHFPKLKAQERSYGIYAGYDGKTVPQVVEFTDEIPARVGIEFGFVLRITGGRGAELDFRIDHPQFKDDRGKVAPAFTGSLFVKTNDYELFLGDTIWEPWQDKCGIWTLSVRFGGKDGIELARRAFVVVPLEESIVG